ncbi:MAG TPA: Gfo/Idh/MocA family oxidoreductase, partial [Steroidobacteraceae bacterium]|nr:Gfo/Idh/MocA family oxidoreductase [Steroidobacteraceae bacterium]
SFQVSCSYGPGRYDPAYERDGHDYPFGLVRWTEQRNFEAVLDLLAAGTLDVQPLVTHRFALADAPRAYDILAGNTEPYLGIVLEYGQRASAAPPQRTIQLAQLATREPQPGAAPALGVIGAGNYAARVLIPAFVRGAPRLIAIASNGGVTAAHLGRKFGFAEVSTDAAAVISDPRVNVVVIATRHDTHAALAAQALRAGKHVFVEKPLALTLDELEALEVAYAVHNVQTAHADRADQASQASQAGDVGQAGRRPLLMVGFNRRFAPHVRRMKSLLQTLPGPKSLLVTVNAGAIPGSHWTQSVSEGGGRLVGEGCHFIDLMRFLTGAPITGWQVAALGSPATGGFENDKVTVTLSFADGSVGTLHYLASGHASFPKERVEVFCGGRILQLDNFRRLRGFGFGARGSLRLWRQDKGQEACVSAFLEAVRAGTPSPIPFAELLEVSRFSIAVGEAARQQGFAPCPP